MAPGYLIELCEVTYGVEIIKEAIHNSKENANINSVDNTELFVGKSEEVIPELIGKGMKPEVIVVDPRRKQIK